MKFLQDLANHLAWPGQPPLSLTWWWLFMMNSNFLQIIRWVLIFFFLVWSRSIAWRLGFESSFLCCGRILKSRMVNVLHDKSQSLLIQTRQPQSVSRLYIHFQLCPERHVCCKAFFFFLYMTFRDFKRLQLNPAFTNSKPFPTARSDTPANIPQLQSSSLAA